MMLMLTLSLQKIFFISNYYENLFFTIPVGHGIETNNLIIKNLKQMKQMKSIDTNIFANLIKIGW